MDVQQLRGDLDRVLEAIRKLNDREQKLLGDLETVRSHRAELDLEVRSIVRTAEKADLEPLEYGLLFGGDLRATMTGALAAAALA
jgi:hypothetical protein